MLFKMTHDQYLKLRQSSQQLIAKNMERLSARGGQNVSVFGQDIAIHVDPQEENAPLEPTWLYVVYGTIQEMETGQTFGPALAAVLPRTTDGDQRVDNNTLFVGVTQVQTIPPQQIIKRVTYYVTTLPPEQSELGPFDQGVFRGGLKLTALFYEETVTGDRIPVREYTLFVGRNGDSVLLEAPELNKQYYLRISAAERL